MLMAAGLQADRVTFNTLLKACMRGNLPDKALHTFRQMQQLKVPVGPLLLTNLAQLHLLHQQFFVAPSCIMIVMVEHPLMVEKRHGNC